MVEKSLFITKRAEELTSFSSFCVRKNLKLTSHSFISFEFIPQKVKTEALVYFFGSRNAFDFFLLLKIPLVHVKIAVVGESTRKHVESCGYSVAFSSKKSGNPMEVASELKLFCGASKIAFFQSNLSKKTIQAYFPVEQKDLFEIYKTILRPCKFHTDFDIYVFTSPSNVDAFFIENLVPNEAKIIAWGEITKSALLAKNVKVNRVLESSSFKELEEILV